MSLAEDNWEDLIMRKLVMPALAGLGILAATVSSPAFAEDGKLAVGGNGWNAGPRPGNFLAVQ